MVHKDDFGNYVGTLADWQVLYKWAKDNVKDDCPFAEVVEEYIKCKGKKVKG